MICEVPGYGGWHHLQVVDTGYVRKLAMHQPVNEPVNKAEHKVYPFFSSVFPWL